jgi:hypothetical protein
MDDPTSYFVSPDIPSLAFTLSGVFMIAIGTFGVFANMVNNNIDNKHVAVAIHLFKPLFGSIIALSTQGKLSILSLTKLLGVVKFLVLCALKMFFFFPKIFQF